MIFFRPFFGKVSLSQHGSPNGTDGHGSIKSADDNALALLLHDNPAELSLFGFGGMVAFYMVSKQVLDKRFHFSNLFNLNAITFFHFFSFI